VLQVLMMGRDYTRRGRGANLFSVAVDLWPESD